MEIPSVSATHGFARSLPAKLERLLDAEDNNNLLQLSKGEKKKIGLLKDQLKQICESLMDPSEVEFPASAAKCWLAEVRELSYDIDDFFDQLASKRPKKWISSEVSRFRIRLQKAIQRYEIYSLKESKMRQQSGTTSSDEERPPPPLFGFEDAYPIGIDDSVVEVEKWLTDQGEPTRRVVTIVGLGGVGKTTLANKLYRNLRKDFPYHAFVRSSQMPDMRELLTSILLQVRPDVTPTVSEWCNLTNTIRAHLRQKKYFIVIDGLWTLSTWDLILQALPDDDNCFSRILTTTEVDAVAYRCCGHNSNYMLRMEPLSKDRTRELFFSRFAGNQPELAESSPEILSKCGGLPLVVVSISSLLEKWSSLSSNLKTNPTVKGMKQVLSLCYNSLPDHLKSCMLYLSIYKQGHIIQKNDLVKQWIAEGFICTKQGKDIEEVASSYFDDLVIKGMIQPVHNSHNGQVNTCTVHYMILQLIQCKSIEENFVITIHHSETNIRLGDKVRRLSLHFGDAEDAKQPDRLELSQVRTLAFYGVMGCMPPLAKFRLLRVIILDLWADQDDIQFKVPTFCMLRYLQIACNVKVLLQIELHGLQYLETLKIDSRRSEVPQNIVDLPRLFHLSLPGDTNLPNCIGHMSSLRTFGCFNLSSNSADNVQSLDKLTDLRDLHLTCSTTISRNLEENLGILSSVLPKLNNLRSLTLVPAENSSRADILGASSTDKNIPCDRLLTVSPPPELLEKVELSPRICIFARLPGWIGDMGNLSVLKIAARELSQSEIDTLNSLPALSALLLYVSIAPSKRIVLMEGFQVLKHFKFVCSTLCLAFGEGAMPSLQSLKLGFNTNRSDHNSLAEAGFENLKHLSAFSAKVGCAGAPEHGRLARSALEDVLRSGARQPIINIHLVDRVFGCDEETSTVGRTDEAQTPEKADVIIAGCRGPAIEISRDGAIGITLSSDPTSTTGNQDIELWKTGDQVLTTDKRGVMSPFSHQTPEGPSESSKKHGDSVNITNVPVDMLNKPSSVDAISEANETHASRDNELWNRKKMDPCGGSRDNMDNAELMKMPYELLKEITHDFSKDNILGSGTYGVVYKAVLNGKEIAVKMLRDMAALDDKAFRNEFQNLARLDHPNIVQLVGYCNELEKQTVERDDGTEVIAERMHVALCFQYVDNGNLHKRISDEYQGLEWHNRYKIIKGICEGLKHLREGLESHVPHLDLKPENILLDKEMVPKIADFGLSRLIGEERAKQTMNSVGTCGYWPPEYVKFQWLSESFDIFSLGVIITKIMIGNEGYHSLADMLPRKLVKHVHNNWKRRLQKTVNLTSLELEAYCQQVKTCIEMASKCLSEDWKQRPTIQEIVVALNDTEIVIRNRILKIGKKVNHTYVMEKYSYELLKSLTDNFSEGRLLGKGGYGIVYKGIHEDGREIAVKVLSHISAFHPEQFQSDIESMARFQHENIIQLAGYCYETEESFIEHEGRLVLAHRIHCAICFEYLQNGSLERYILDESDGLDWCTCYKIIKGTCNGLQYLHEGLPGSVIMHFDLKPSNILLDGNMVPKIADFALGYFGNDAITMISDFGTPKYLPPEFFTRQIISKKFDIYSLGIIILEMVAGISARSLFHDDMISEDSIKLVLGKWRKRLEATMMGRRSLVEKYCHQVKECIQIALECVEADRHKRPSISHIVDVLDITENKIHEAGLLLGAIKEWQ